MASNSGKAANDVSAFNGSTIPSVGRDKDSAFKIVVGAGGSTSNRLGFVQETVVPLNRITFMIVTS